MYAKKLYFCSIINYNVEVALRTEQLCQKRKIFIANMQKKKTVASALCA